MSATIVAISANGHAAVSTDGTTWNVNAALNAINAGGWGAIAYSPSLNLMCALSSSGSLAALSGNGTSWTSHSTGLVNLNAICWSPALGKFCAVGAGSGGVNAATSSDGVTWATHSIGESNTWGAVCWSPAKNLFCAVAVNGTHQIATSPDGATWTLVVQPMSSLQAVAWDPTTAQFCVSCYSTNRSATSPDGVTWTLRASNTPLNAGNHSNMIALAAGGFMVTILSQSVATSPDGITWTTRTFSNGAGALAECATYSAVLSLYAVGCSASSGDGIMTSPDGTTWTPIASVTGQVYVAIASGDILQPPAKRRFGTVIC